MDTYFIDFNKTFDSIKLPPTSANIWMKQDSKKYINLSELTYGNSTAILKTDIVISRIVLKAITYRIYYDGLLLL